MFHRIMVETKMMAQIVFFGFRIFNSDMCHNGSKNNEKSCLQIYGELKWDSERSYCRVVWGTKLPSG